MKLTILFIVVVGAILVWWLRSVKAKQDLTPTRRAAGFMRSVLSLALGCFLIAVGIKALAQSPPRKLSPGDFDLACAVAAGAEMGASQNEQNVPRRDMAVRLFIFYLGRLSGRDDSKDWNAIAWGRVAELQQEARSPEMLDRCLAFYNSKTK